MTDRIWDALALAIGLTPCELDVLKLIYQDKTQRAIANALGITIHTVDMHARHVRQKFGVKHLGALIAKVDQFAFAHRNR